MTCEYERIAGITGSVLTGVIGLFVVITCAATLHARGVRVESAANAAEALAPLAGPYARSLSQSASSARPSLPPPYCRFNRLFPVANSRSTKVASTTGSAALRGSTPPNLAIAGLAAVIVLQPGLPLIRVLVLTQVLNALLLLPLLVFMYALARDP
jgi:Mn2+/Fe2+ NRAMP family transporter